MSLSTEKMDVPLWLFINAIETMRNVAGSSHTLHLASIPIRFDSQQFRKKIEETDDLLTCVKV